MVPRVAPVVLASLYALMLVQSGCCPELECLYGPGRWGVWLIFDGSVWDFDEDVPDRFLLVEAEIQEQPGDLFQVREIMEFIRLEEDWRSDHDGGTWLFEISNQPCSLSVQGTLTLVDELEVPIDEVNLPAFSFTYHTEDVWDGPPEPWPATELYFTGSSAEYCHFL